MVQAISCHIRTETTANKGTSTDIGTSERSQFFAYEYAFDEDVLWCFLYSVV